MNFPITAFEDLGWYVVVHGQKSYNGVASRIQDPKMWSMAFRAMIVEHARYMEATIMNFRVAWSVFQTETAPGPKFDYKLDWLDRLEARAKKLLEIEMPIVLGGDYNVIPDDKDCFDPAGWAGDALTRPESQTHYAALFTVVTQMPSAAFILLSFLYLLGLSSWRMAARSQGSNWSFCCHQRRLTGWRKWQLIVIRVGWKNHLITHQSYVS